MTTQTNIVEQKLIDKLVSLRREFIDTNVNAMTLHKKAIQLSRDINGHIPDINAGYLDDFDTVFFTISASLGENTRNRTRPKDSSIMSISDAKMRKLITKAVDGRLWNMMFNRLGLFKSMSETQISSFNNDCRNDPMPFTLDVITATLANIANNQHEMMIEALYDTFNNLKSTYVSNNVCMFGKKVIIDNSFFKYGDTFKLRSHCKLETLLNVVWRWVLVNKWEMTEIGSNANQIWDELSGKLSASMQDYDEIRSIECFGIEFNFFKNANVHVIFTESMISILNSQLANKNYIAQK